MELIYTFRAEGARGICQKDDHFGRDDLKALELKAFSTDFPLKRKRFKLEVCMDLMHSMVTAVNTAVWDP